MERKHGCIAAVQMDGAILATALRYLDLDDDLGTLRGYNTPQLAHRLVFCGGASYVTHVPNPNELEEIEQKIREKQWHRIGGRLVTHQRQLVADGNHHTYQNLAQLISNWTQAQLHNWSFVCISIATASSKLFRPLEAFTKEAFCKQ